MSTPQPEDQFKLKLRDTPSPYLSSLVAQLPKGFIPDPQPACASCPASMWRATTKRIDCLCRTAGKISWDGKQEPTLFCDGREAAIARLNEEMAGRS